MSIQKGNEDWTSSEMSGEIDKEKLLKYLAMDISSNEREIDRIIKEDGGDGLQMTRILLEVKRGKVLAYRYLISQIYSGEFDR